jgi:acetyl-CoA carboxylase carboxyl transferase subunit alpha
MKITARDLKQRGIVDEVLPEPLGGAHQEPEEATEVVGETLARVLTGLSGSGPEELVETRYERYRDIGAHMARQP